MGFFNYNPLRVHQLFVKHDKLAFPAAAAPCGLPESAFKLQHVHYVAAYRALKPCLCNLGPDIGFSPYDALDKKKPVYMLASDVPYHYILAWGQVVKPYLEISQAVNIKLLYGLFNSLYGFFGSVKKLCCQVRIILRKLREVNK